MTAAGGIDWDDDRDDDNNNNSPGGCAPVLSFRRRRSDTLGMDRSVGGPTLTRTPPMIAVPAVVRRVRYWFGTREGRGSNPPCPHPIRSRGDAPVLSDTGGGWEGVQGDGDEYCAK